MKNFKYFETNVGKTLMSATTIINEKEVIVTVTAEGKLELSSNEEINLDKDLHLIADTFTYTDPTSGDECELVEEKEEVSTEPIIGKFKMTKPLLGFFRMKGKFRLNSDYAFIEAEEFSGTFESGVKLKLTLCSENTINFEEVSTDLIDDAMAQRFLDDLVDQNAVLWNGKSTFPKYKFTDDKDNRMYLEVDEPKLINKLKNLFDEDEKNKKVSQKSKSFLDDLLGTSNKTEETTEEVEVIEEVIEETTEETPMSYAQDMMAASFAKMNKDKIDELEARVTLKEKDIMKYTHDIERAHKLQEQVKEDVRILTTRLETLKPKNDPNGYVFYVGTEVKAPEVDDEATKDVVSKLAPFLKLREEALLDLVKKSYYEIYIAPKDDIDNKKLTSEIYGIISHLDPLGRTSLVKDTHFEYRGEYNWHKLVDRMTKLGFEQDPEFDKKCGSNSYYSASLGAADETVEEEAQPGNGKARKMKGDSIVLGQDGNGNMTTQEVTLGNTPTPTPNINITPASGPDVKKIMSDEVEIFVK